jgi:hypothetical protein
MPVLHLGVLEMPYRTRGKKTAALTTFDVAKILEAKHGIMQTFYNTKEAKIAKMFEKSVARSLESSLMRGKRVDPYASAMQGIQQEFRDFISLRQIERLGIPGVPTIASGGTPNAKGQFRATQHRLLHPYAKSNPRRPSFRDTGTYVGSMRAWMSSEKD